MGCNNCKNKDILCYQCNPVMNDCFSPLKDCTEFRTRQTEQDMIILNQVKDIDMEGEKKMRNKNTERIVHSIDVLLKESKEKSLKALDNMKKADLSAIHALFSGEELAYRYMYNCLEILKEVVVSELNEI